MSAPISAEIRQKLANLPSVASVLQWCDQNLNEIDATARKERFMARVTSIYSQYFNLTQNVDEAIRLVGKGPSAVAPTTTVDSNTKTEIQKDIRKVTKKIFPKVCSSCNKASEIGNKLLTCGGCHTAYYCSQACQKNAWPEHKEVCQFIAAEKS